MNNALANNSAYQNIQEPNSSRSVNASCKVRMLNVFLPLFFALTLSFVCTNKSIASMMVPDAIYHGYQLVQDWDIDAAEKLSQQLLKKYPESGDAHFLQARVEFMKGNYERSWKILRHVDDNFEEIKKFKKHVDATRRASKKFISKETEHFIFRFIEGPDEVLLLDAEKALEASYQVLGKLLNYYPEEKVLVEFYPDRKPFSQISPLTLQDILTSGTVALCKYNRIMIISPGSLVRGFNWMDTLSHEYVHFLLTKKSRNRLPLWMHEGIAKYLEANWRGENTYLSPLMETILSNALKTDYRVPLSAMMPSLAKLKNAKDVQLAYAEVSSMMEFLALTKGPNIFAHVLQDLASDEKFERVFMKHAGQDLNEFQNSWGRWAKKLTLKNIPGIEPLKPEFKNNQGSDAESQSYKQLSSKKARDLTFLGDLLKSRDHYDAAILEYKKAVGALPTHSPILFNKLAGIYLQTKNYDAAELALKNSLVLFPNFHTTLTNLGELFFINQNYAKARDYFERAIRINPFNPFVHMRLILVYDKLELAVEKKLQAKQFNYID